MSSYQVRTPLARDAKGLAECHVQSWQAAYQGLVPDAHLSAMSVEKRQAFWREAIDIGEPQVLVATDERGRIVGFVAYDRSRDKGTPQTTGEIWALFVAPDHWSKGVGLALWDAARDGLREEGCTKVTLWLPLRNDRALRFVELAGFKRQLSSAKTVDVGGAKVEEIRLQRAIS